MKQKIIFFALVSLALNGTTTAQLHRGGFGNFFIGPAYSITTSLQNDLGSSELLGNGMQFNKMGFLFGGAGYSVRSNGVVLGGSGIIYETFSKTSDGEVTFENSAGFFNAGYCVVNRNDRLGFPYLGIGWHSAMFRVFNPSADKIFVIGSDTIAGNEAGKFTKDGFAFEVGYALKYFFFDEEDEEEKTNKKFATIIGVDAGASFFPASENWKGSAEIVSMKRPYMMVIYLRISLGFGTFRKK